MYENFGIVVCGFLGLSVLLSKIGQNPFEHRDYVLHNPRDGQRIVPLFGTRTKSLTRLNYVPSKDLSLGIFFRLKAYEYLQVEKFIIYAIQ